MKSLMFRKWIYTQMSVQEGIITTLLTISDCLKSSDDKVLQWHF